MIFNSSNMQVMRTGLDALAARQKVILHNMANYETPNYKAQEVVFEQVLAKANKKGEKKLAGVKAEVFTKEDTTVRPDGNNVDADAENLKLYENYVQTMYVYNKISAQINNYRYVLKQSPK